MRVDLDIFITQIPEGLAQTLKISRSNFLGGFLNKERRWPMSSRRFSNITEMKHKLFKIREVLFGQIVLLYKKIAIKEIEI